MEVGGTWAKYWYSEPNTAMFNTNHVVIGMRLTLPSYSIAPWSNDYPWARSQYNLWGGYSGAWIDFTALGWLWWSYTVTIWRGSLATDPSTWSLVYGPATKTEGAYYANAVHVPAGYNYVIQFNPGGPDTWTFQWTFWYDTIPSSGGGACNRNYCPT